MSVIYNTLDMLEEKSIYYWELQIKTAESNEQII